HAEPPPPRADAPERPPAAQRQPSRQAHESSVADAPARPKDAVPVAPPEPAGNRPADAEHGPQTSTRAPYELAPPTSDLGRNLEDTPPDFDENYLLQSSEIATGAMR